MDFAALEEIQHDDLYEHLYTAYTEHRPRANQHLGYVDKSTDEITITLPLASIDVSIRQSLSALSSATQSSSTGFICWQTASHFVDWLSAHRKCPIKIDDSVVLELGAGVSSLLSSVLGPQTKHYVASDQSHVLKLMKENFVNNVVSQRYTSSTSEKSAGGPKQEAEKWGKIDFMSLDWEHPETGISEFAELTGHKVADYVFACDTIYNSYLIPYFVACVKSVMDEHTVAVVAMQLRDEAITEEFLEEAFKLGFCVYRVRDEWLTQELIEGFIVYCLKRTL